MTHTDSNPDHNQLTIPPNEKLRFPKYYILLDTETTQRNLEEDVEKIEKKIRKGQYETGDGIKYKPDFRLVHAKFLERTYTRDEGLAIQEKDTITLSENDKKPKQKFWKWVDKKYESVDEDIIMFAHNMDFDFKILEAPSFLKNLNYNLSKPYVKGNTFIFSAHKDSSQKLKMWSTTNYFRCSLDYLGKTLGLKKLQVDYNTDNMEKLKTYCKRDVEILTKTVTKLIKFLYKDRLVGLRPTASSIAYNCYRHNSTNCGKYVFYDNEKTPIQTHHVKNFRKLEYFSYRGGMCELFKKGDFTDQKIYYLDVASEYPSIMKEKNLPRKLLGYTSNEEKATDKINTALKDNKRDVIAKVDINLPRKHGHIVRQINKKGGQKSTMRLGGKYTHVLTTPELEFVKKHGNLEKIHCVLNYESDNLFENYVKYFYEKRMKYREKNNEVFELLCKLLLNGLSGKFGQKKRKTQKLNLDPNILNRYGSGKILLNNKLQKQLGVNKRQIDITNFFGEIYHTKEYKWESNKIVFPPVISFVTAHGRINYLLDCCYTAGLNETYYVDTDSVHVTEKGFKRLKKANWVSENKKILGKLEIERISKKGEKTIFIAPKWYKMGDKLKHKGENSEKVVYDNETKRVTIEEMFRSLKGNLRKKEKGQTTKLRKKTYDKNKDYGKIKNENVLPYTPKELKEQGHQITPIP